MELWISFTLLLLLGLVAAIFGSIVGLGGGIILVPGLALLSPAILGEAMSSTVAVGTSLAVLIFSAFTSTLTYAKQRRVDYASGALFFSTSGPAAMLGASLTATLEGPLFYVAFGVFMLAMSLLLVLRDRLKPLHIDWKRTRTYTDPSGVTTTYGYNILPALGIGLAVGFISGLFGIGGGSLFVPLMVLIFRFPPHVATATSMLVILLSAVLGSATHLYMGHVDAYALLALVPGALLGGWVGARIANRMSGKALMFTLRLTLFMLSVYLIWRGLS